MVFVSESLDPEFLRSLFLILLSRLPPGFLYILLLMIVIKSGFSPLRYLRIVCFFAARYLRRIFFFNFLYLKLFSEFFLKFSDSVYSSSVLFFVIFFMSFLCVSNVSLFFIK